MNWYYLNDAGEVAGPVSDSTLAELRSINRLADDTQVCREGSEDWVSLAETLGTIIMIPGKPAEAAAPSRQLTPKKKKNSRKGALIGMIAGVMIAAGATIFFLSRDGAPKSANQTESVTEASEAPTSQKETENDLHAVQSDALPSLGAKFWNFQFGQTYEKSISIIKSLKDLGEFKTLNNSSGRAWMPEANSVIHAYGGNGTTLDALLSFKCSGLFLLFKDKRLVGIELSYAFKSENVNHVARQTKDMERAFSLDSKYTDSEDDLGNTTRTITLDGPTLGVKIVDKLNEGFAPSTRIFSKHLTFAPISNTEDTHPTATEQFLLGKKHEEGNGVPKDLTVAATWYRKAGEQNEPRALHALAMMHMKGQGVKKDEKEALCLLSEAANYGHHESQFILGSMHKGQGEKLLACFWLYLAKSSPDDKIKTLARSEMAAISGQLTGDEINTYVRLCSSWKPGQKGTAGMYLREKGVDEDDKAKHRVPTSVEDGPALSFDNKDVEKLLLTKYPNNAKLRSRAADGIREIMKNNRTTSPEAALETLESIWGGIFTNEVDANKAFRNVEKLLNAAAYTGMTGDEILKIALESQERIHSMTKDIWGEDSRATAAIRANEMVVSAALAVKQEQETANKSAPLGIELGPVRTLKQVLVYKENEMVHFQVNYSAITMLVGGGAAKNPSTKERAEELLSDFRQAENPIARRHLELKARELIVEAEFGSAPSAKARRSEKEVIKFTPMPKNVSAPLPADRHFTETSVDVSNLVSHYKSIGFSEDEAKQFIDIIGDKKKYDAPKAMSRLAALYEGRTMFDVKNCMSWLYKAAEAGSTDAMFRLHQILYPNFALSFLGYPEGDAKQSRDWAMKAAEHGHADGMNAIGYYNWYGEYENDGGELIMHPDKSQALVWWRKAAEAGSADAAAQIEKYRNGIPTTENRSATSRQPNTDSAANSKTPAASDVVLPNAALSALQLIRSATLDEARECVRLLDEQLKQDPGNTRIQKVKSTITDIFREEALLVEARGNYQKAEKLLATEKRNLAITSKPSALSGRVNHDEVARTRGKVNAAQTAMQSEKSQGEKSRSSLQKLLNDALSELPGEERDALAPVWHQVAKRHQIKLRK